MPPFQLRPASWAYDTIFTKPACSLTACLACLFSLNLPGQSTARDWAWSDKPLTLPLKCNTYKIRMQFCLNAFQFVADLLVQKVVIWFLINFIGSYFTSNRVVCKVSILLQGHICFSHLYMKHVLNLHILYSITSLPLLNINTCVIIDELISLQIQGLDICFTGENEPIQYNNTDRGNINLWLPLRAASLCIIQLKRYA